MQPATLPASVPVLIVGAGPIGLALAADLGRRGIRTLVVERRDDQPVSAKMIVVSVRTMEFCRQLGVAPAVRDWGFPFDHGLDSLFVTTLQGHELGRVRTPPLSVPCDTPFSPERERPCPQTWFDPILKRFALGQPGVSLHYQIELADFEQSDDGVRARLVDRRTGDSHEIEAGYLVGCDGYASTVRERLGIAVRGEKHLSHSLSAYVDIPGLYRQHPHGQGYRYVFVGDEGVWGVLTTIDGHDFYRFQVLETGSGCIAPEALDGLLRRALGPGIDYQLRDVSHWVRKATVTDRFSDGRVFLAGDSAHAHPPNGGLGMNTGILDAWDLGWKLAAVIQGWGGPHLLESYDIERRPAVTRAVEESLRNYHRLVDEPTGTGVGLEGSGPDAERLRAETGARLVRDNEQAWHPVGIHLGHVYCPSPIVVDDGSPIHDPSPYVPSARPGARAPHVWLGPEHSILDEFGPGFTLLRLAEPGGTKEAEARDAVAAAAIQSAAEARGLPLRIVRPGSTPLRELYGADLVLVRPDGHVAWRGSAGAIEPGWLIDRIRGAGPQAAAGVRPATPAPFPP